MVDVRLRDYAVAMPIDPNNRILLQGKDAEYFFWPNMWCTFGGGVREDEKPMDALVREMREENGLVLTDVELFDSREFVDSYQPPNDELIVRTGTTHYFEARFDGDLSKIVFKEGAGFKTFSIDELCMYNELGLVVPSNYEAIRDFYENMKSD